MKYIHCVTTRQNKAGAETPDQMSRRSKGVFRKDEAKIEEAASQTEDPKAKEKGKDGAHADLRQITSRCNRLVGSLTQGRWQSLSGARSVATTLELLPQRFTIRPFICSSICRDLNQSKAANTSKRSRPPFRFFKRALSSRASTATVTRKGVKVDERS